MVERELKKIKKKEIKEKKPSNKMNMLEGNLLPKMLKFAIPLAISSILQQLFNAIDIAVVGRFATSQDQAAVGCNSSLINLLLNLFIGIAVGTNVVIARYIGQGKIHKVEKAVHTAMLVAIIGGFLLIAVGLPISRPVLELMGTPEDTLDLAVLYFRIYMIGMPVILIYNFGAAILRSVGDTKRPMYILVVSGIINTVLNLILVIVFHLGVEGVAIATVVANCVSAIRVILILVREEGVIHLDLKKLRISRPELRRMLRIGVPSGLQGMVFSVANVFIQSAINSFGSTVVAGSAAGLNFEIICYFIVSAFSQTVVTFTSQNYGAGDIDRCKKVFKYGMISGIVASQTVALIFVLGRNYFISLFTNDPEVAFYGAERILMICSLYFLINTYEISGAAMRGLGHSLTPAILTLIGTCVFRLAWIYLVFPILHTFRGLLIVYPLSWILSGAMVIFAYVRLTKKVYKRTT